MQNQFLYPGIGKTLNKASASTGNADAGTSVIGNNEYSQAVAAHDCREILFAVEFPSQPAAGNVIVQVSFDPVNGSWETHATVAATGKRYVSWAAGTRLLGHYRIFNSGTSLECTVKHNKSMV